MRAQKNEMEISFDAVSWNESFARVAVAAFVTHLNPTLEEIDDVKTAVSEAVTNAIIHGYDNFARYDIEAESSKDIEAESSKDIEAESSKVIEAGGSADLEAVKRTKQGKVLLHCTLEGDVLHIEVADRGKGIEDVEQAMEPLFTTRPDLDRSGMGFAFMEAFMDELEVESEVGKGTVVRMTKKLGCSAWIDCED